MSIQPVARRYTASCQLQRVRVKANGGATWRASIHTDRRVSLQMAQHIVNINAAVMAERFKLIACIFSESWFLGVPQEL
jgi:hypothetical protein